MEINFLKNKSEKKPDKKEAERKFAIDYTTVANPKKSIPPKPPMASLAKKTAKNKISFWQKIKSAFFSPPVLKKAVQLSVPKPPVKALNKTVLPVLEKPKVKILQKQDAGVYIPPSMPKEGAATHQLKKTDYDKIKKREYASSFLGVNLIPRELIDKIQPLTKIRRLLWAVIFSWLAVFIIYGAMLWYQGYLMNSVKKTQMEIANTDLEIESYRPWQNEAIAFSNQVEDISKILDQHIYWTAFFSFLEANTLPEVRYANLSGDVSGTFSLSAVGPDYKTVSRQIALFKNSPLITSVSVTSATTGASANTLETENSIVPVQFNISLTVKPDVFYKQNDL